jgi:hypothetical protein
MRPACNRLSAAHGAAELIQEVNAASCIFSIGRGRPGQAVPTTATDAGAGAADASMERLFDLRTEANQLQRQVRAGG